jgi:hypothetical protein
LSADRRYKIRKTGLKTRPYKGKKVNVWRAYRAVWNEEGGFQ